MVDAVLTTARSPLCTRARWPEGRGRALIACSGGADSLALFALAATAGFDVVAAHVDHGLRPCSDADLAVVEHAASALHVPVVSRRLDVEAGSNVEARARAARYAALQLLASETGSIWIFTGHTLDDQAETVLLATLRGSGLDGLAGIPWNRENVFRPLLGIRAHETRELCRRLGWAPVVDPMNDDPAYTRVWLRRELMPALAAAADRDLAVVLARQAEIVRAEAGALDDLASALVPEAGGPLDCHGLRAAPVALARRAVRRWLPVAASAATIDSVLAVGMGGPVAVDVGRGWRVRRTAGRLHLEGSGTSDRHGSVESFEPSPLRLPGSAGIDGVVVRTRIDLAPPVAWPDGRMTCVLDADAIGDELVVRRPDPGERFHPLGLRGTQSVVDARAHAGMVPAQRTRLPVVARADGTIVWVLGYRGSHPARVTSTTRRYCWMTAEPASPEDLADPEVPAPPELVEPVERVEAG